MSCDIREENEWECLLDMPVSTHYWVKWKMLKKYSPCCGGELFHLFDFTNFLLLQYIWSEILCFWKCYCNPEFAFAARYFPSSTARIADGMRFRKCWGAFDVFVTCLLVTGHQLAIFVINQNETVSLQKSG